MEFDKPRPQSSKVVVFLSLCGTFRVLCSNNPSIGCSEWQRNLRLCLKCIVVETVCATKICAFLLDCLRI